MALEYEANEERGTGNLTASEEPGLKLLRIGNPSSRIRSPVSAMALSNCCEVTGVRVMGIFQPTYGWYLPTTGLLFFDASVERWDAKIQ